MKETEGMIIERYEKNTKGYDYIVGDIHAMFSLLEKELDLIGFDPNVDRLFCVGDLIDRGPDNVKFLDWLEKPWFHSVRGNHEMLLIGHYLQDRWTTECHMANGGMWYCEWNLDQQTREKMYKACLRLPYIIEIETDTGLVGIVHADTGDELDWEVFKQKIKTRDEKTRECAVWSRQRYYGKQCSFIEGISRVYVGHTPVHSVTSYGNVCYIDTGACFKQGYFSIERIN